MATYDFNQLLYNFDLSATFNPETDTLSLSQAANAFAVRYHEGQTYLVTSAGTVVLAMNPAQIVSHGSQGGNLTTTNGQLVIGDNQHGIVSDHLANEHTASTAAGDQFHGLGGDDSFIGGLGNDLAYGNRDADFLFGASGDDTLYGGQSNSEPDVVSGGIGDDLIYGNRGVDMLDGDGGDDTLYGGQDEDYILGGSGNDVIYGNLGNDIIYGNKGIDIVYGNLGADTLRGGDDGDFLYGGQGKDDLFGGAGGDLIYGNLEDDWMLGESGGDTLYGGQGHDSIDGGTGNDLLFGNRGNDTLVGSAGGDLFVISAGSGQDVDVIKDFQIGLDSLDLRGVTTSTDNVQQDGSTVDVILSSGDRIVFDGALRDDILDLMEPYLGDGQNGSGGDSGDTGSGDNGGGNGGGNGGAGNGNQGGGGGNNGSTQAEYHGLGNGEDVFTGGPGKDIIRVGAGRDILIYEDVSTDGHDMILDFTPGEDVIDLDLLFDTLGIATDQRAPMVIIQEGNGASMPTVLTIEGHEEFSITLLHLDDVLVIGTDIWLGGL